MMYYTVIDIAKEAECSREWVYQILKKKRPDLMDHPGVLKTKRFHCDRSAFDNILEAIKEYSKIPAGPVPGKKRS